MLYRSSFADLFDWSDNVLKLLFKLFLSKLLIDYEQQNAYISLILIVCAFHFALYKIPKTHCVHFIMSEQEKLCIPRNLLGSQRKKTITSNRKRWCFWCTCIAAIHGNDFEIWQLHLLLRISYEHCPAYKLLFVLKFKNTQDFTRHVTSLEINKEMHLKCCINCFGFKLLDTKE